MERRDLTQGAMLRAWMNNHVLPEFAGRILAVDLAVALRCARLHIPDSRSERDALIAATALVHGMTVVTRNVADFKQTGVLLLNPWRSKVYKNSADISTKTTAKHTRSEHIYTRFFRRVATVVRSSHPSLP